MANNITTTITNVRVVQNGRTRMCNVRVSEGRIQGILPPGDAYGKIIDGHGMVAIPGLIDLHVHGGWGVSVNDADARELRTLRDFCAAHGVTSFLPTIFTDSDENMLRAAAASGEAKRQMSCPQIAGIHLEGPFLAPAWVGEGVRPEDLHRPDYSLYRRIQDASRGLVTRVTLSPELPGAAQLTARLAADGVKVTLGHSGASYKEAMACIRAGATGVTHIFHCTAPLTREAPGLVAAALEADLFCEVICDGACTPAPLIRMLLSAKGEARTVAASGGLFLTGLGEGLYQLHGRKAALRDGSLVYLEGDDWAGSVLTPEKCLIKLGEMTGKAPEQCASLFSESPARMMGLSHRKGSLEVGKDADMVLLDKNYQVRLTISQGSVIYDSAAAALPPVEKPSPSI